LGPETRTTAIPALSRPLDRAKIVGVDSSILFRFLGSGGWQTQTIDPVVVDHVALQNFVNIGL
jgi:hypothetical protein